MKKLILCLFLLSLVFFVSTKKVFAFGSFQIVTFDSSITVVTHQKVSIPIQYIYSGNDVSRATFISSEFPDGLKLSSINYGYNGLDSLTYSGTPTIPGEYNLKLLLTDNNGASLTEDLVLKVIDPEKIKILSVNLPDGYVGQSYQGDIVASYICEETPSVGRDGLPEGIEIVASFNRSDKTIIKHGTTTIFFKGVPTKAGKYNIKVDLQNTDSDGHKNKLTQTFPVNVIDPAKTSSIGIGDNVIKNESNYKNSSSSRITEQFIKEEKNKLIKIDLKLVNKLKGKILLQAESSGEAWYVNPADGKRYYMANGNEAYNVMKKLSLGVTNDSFDKINSSKIFAKKYSGKILLKVTDFGKAYYVNYDGTLYYLKDGDSAYDAMRKLGLGISNSNIRKINIGE